MDLRDTVNILASVNQTLEQVKATEPVHSVDQLIEHHQLRKNLQAKLRQLDTALQALYQLAHSLPTIPPFEVVRWAQNILAMPNLAFLELDTTGLYESAEIIRALVLDRGGNTLLDLYAQSPTRALNADIERITGITTQDLIAKGQPIQVVIEQLRTVLHGKYVLSYNLDFDAGKLQEATTRLGIESLTFIGEDLMEHAMKYYSLRSYPKLEVLCRRIGSPLPEQLHQTAFHRAEGQLALLKAIANVVTDAQPTTSPPTAVEDTDAETLDEHPF
ncbi:3'-5' exonuclease [Dictyobacter formicarum]|uniref:Exonuclease domain-containing protein n=1 Tax=Dictyobacter formicarum TaxID=2778368 RepID=A0ABQ3VAG2_9CHLR|nr:3'-5' exonuclease [Dictyobacter formicarum]GHO82994.1 hypothetical protein KSZ_10000 [Dictyobacter formicarum]